MVPMLRMISSRFIPMPLSVRRRMPFSLSASMRMRNVASSPRMPAFVSDSKRALSIASEAFDTSSRRKISLFEYSAWIIRCSSCLTSVWNSIFSGACVVIAVSWIRKNGE